MLDLSVLGHTTWEYRSTEKLSYKYTKAVEKTNKKGDKTYTAIKGEPEREISIRWHDDQQGQHLTFWDNTTQVAKFTLTNEKEIIWLPTDALLIDQDITAKPSNPNNIPIVVNKLLLMFKVWVNSQPFARYLDQLSRELVYPPKLVKMLLLFNAYLNIRTKTAEKLGKLTDDIDITVDKSQVANVFKILLAQVVGDTPHMLRLYADSSQFLLPSSNDAQPTTEPEKTEPEVASVPKTEATEPAEVVEVTATTHPTTEMLKRIETKASKKTYSIADVEDNKPQ